MKVIAVNKKAYFDYEILTTYEAGISLTGSEIKSIRANNVTLKDSFVVIKKNEAFLLNMNIATYKFSSSFIVDPNRTRKLLLHRKEIKKILMRVKLEKLTIVGLKLYFKNNLVKVEIGLAKGKKNYDKRQVIKERDDKRATNKIIKNYHS